MFPDVFPERLKEVRESKKLSQIEVASKLGVSKQSIANWENDNIMPSIGMLRKISEYFNVTSDFLLGLNDRKFVDVSELSLEETAHVQAIINDLNGKRTKNK